MTANNVNNKELPVIVRVPKNIIQFVIFLLIQILLLPLTIAGTVVVVVRQLLISKKLGASDTAVEVLHNRWLYHYFRTREDEATVKVYKALPTASHYGMFGMFGAAIIANRICGFSTRLVKPSEPGKESFLTFLPSRTTPIGADWANLGAFQHLHALSVDVVAGALTRTCPAAQFYRYTDAM